MMPHDYYQLTVARQKMAELAAEARQERLAREGRPRTRGATSPGPGLRHRIQRFVTDRGWLARPATKPNPAEA